MVHPAVNAESSMIFVIVLIKQCENILEVRTVP